MTSTDLTNWQIQACRSVCGWWDDPVGEPLSTEEIVREALGGQPWCGVAGARPPADPQAELDELVERGYLLVFRSRHPDSLGQEHPGVYEPTDEARKLYPEKYPQYATETVERCDCGVRVDAATDRLLLPNEPNACPSCGGSLYTKLHFGEELGGQGRGCGKPHSYWYPGGIWHCHACGKFVRPSSTRGRDGCHHGRT